MPGGTSPALGNEQFDTMIYLPSVVFPTLTTSASGTNTLSVPGVQNLDAISWNLQNPPAHIFLENAYVSAPNTLTLLWTTDLTGVTGATVAILFTVVRAQNAAFGTAGLPNGIY